ncbi:MAG: 50S ribosomal protein L18 [Actinobacteria bacterium]|nr:50S ribosomal protein L18 [Actinomycetota bacterium]
MAISSRATMRHRRHARVRKSVSGTPSRPRLSVFRSARHIQAQIIDDTSGRTLVAASTTEPGFKSGDGGKLEAAREVGRLLASRAQAKGIKLVVFDRGGFRYHGRVAALGDGAREEGLEF